MKAVQHIPIQSNKIINTVQDFFFEKASSPLGFLRVILFLRFGIFLILMINFGLLLRNSLLAPSSHQQIPVILVAYLVFFLFLLVMLHFHQIAFVSRPVQLLQIVVDSSVILYLYRLSGQPGSELFLMLFLPVLVLARFYDFPGVFLFVFFVTALTTIVWFFELNIEELLSFRYWFQILLPKFGFLFILAFFYLIYYRRRGIDDRLQKAAQGLIEGLDELWNGSFNVDRSLSITWADENVHVRHKFPETGGTCAEILCQRGFPGGGACAQCPIAGVFEGENYSREHRTTFIDREGVRYLAGLQVTPQLGREGNVVAASVRVQDLDRRKAYEIRLRSYVENFERAVDQRRSEESTQLVTMTRRVTALTEALETLPDSDLEEAIKEVILTAARFLNAQVLILGKPTLEVISNQIGLQIAFYSGLPPADAERMAFLPLQSNSLAVKAFNSGSYQSVEDLTNSAHPYFLTELRKNSLHAQACFPLKTQGQIIGVLSLFRKWAGGFSTEEMELGQAFANIAALMIASRDAMSEISQQAEERQNLLATLETFGLSLTPRGHPQEQAQQVADLTCQKLHAETAAVFLQDGNLLRRLAITGLDSEWFSEECYRVGQGLTGQAAITSYDRPNGQPVIENNVPQSPIVLPDNLENYRRELTSGEVYHLVAVPISGQGGPFGVLRVVNKLNEDHTPNPIGFSQQDVDTMQAVASSVGIVLEYSLRSRKQQILAEIAQSFTALLTYEEVLLKSLEQAVQLLGAEAGFILLPGEPGETMMFEVAIGEGAYRLQGETLPEGHGVAYKVFRDCEPQLVTDANNDDRFEGWLYQRTGLYIRSLLSVPILSAKKVIGVLELVSQYPGTFSLADASLLGELTPWIGIAISNAVQFKTQEMRANIMSQLEASLQEIGAATDKKLTMNNVADAASRLMGCEFAGVALYDKARQEIYALPDAGYVGVSPEYARAFRFSVDRPGGRVLREERVFTSEDASSDPHSIFGQRLVLPLEARGVIAAPLRVGEHIVGVLYAATRTRRRWTDDQSAFFSILAKHSAIAIRNAELLDLRERRAQLLNLLHEISIAGQLTTDINLILNIILTAITAEYGLRFNRALLMLYDKQRGILQGFTGIGQLERKDAQQIWENLDHESHNMKAYVREVLENRRTPAYTAMHYKAGNLAIPVNSASAEVLGRVLRTRRAEVIDAQQDEVLVQPDFYRIMQPGLFVVTPLVANDEAIGVLVVDNKFSGEPIGDLERELLNSCASQAAAAIQRSQLHREVEQQVKALDHLQQVVQGFSKLDSPREALIRIAQAAKDLLHADISQLIPYDTKGKKLLIEDAVGAGIPIDFSQNPDISEHGLTRRVMDEVSDMLVIEDLGKLSGLNSHFVNEFNVKSVVGCRLVFADEIVGVLYVDYCTPHRFDGAELDILHTLAKHAAVAIHNSRLMKENQMLAVKAERSRLRDDLHDILGKLQFKISAEAESFYEKLKHRRDRTLANQAEDLWRYARHIYDQLERILEDMADPTLEEFGLPEALRNLLVEERLPAETLTVQGDVRPSAVEELMLYRICQEAVANVLKHAQLPEDKRGLVEINLEQASDHTRLVVQDRGVGFSPELLKNKRAGIGLASMRARAKKINANIKIDPTPGEGVYIEVVIPRHQEVSS